MPFNKNYKADYEKHLSNIMFKINFTWIKVLTLVGMSVKLGDLNHYFPMFLFHNSYENIWKPTIRGKKRVLGQ